MKIFFALLIPGLISGGAYADSTHLNNFKIQQCREADCVRATGAVGFISSDGGILAAEKVTVEFSGSHRKKTVCDSFRYEVRNQYLVCDNREVTGKAFIVNSALQRRDY